MRKHLLLSIIFLFAAVAAFAQVTTSSMTGLIKDGKGETLIGATIKATHQPSGSTYATTTNADGRFTINNMRVGGPYTVVVSYIGYDAKTVTDVYLKLGEGFVLNETLSQGAAVLSEVNIVATNPRSIMNGERNGAITNIGTREILTLPTITRNINDLTRLTPQANGTSIGGGNFRQNYITVDGSDFNNSFGIGGNLPAGGSPISLDALEEISVNVTPYDVTQSGFIGSALNAVTRSGTNDISGSVYTYWRNQEQQGINVGPNMLQRQPLNDRTWGARVGGPIVKNKLFLFVNAERQTTTRPGQSRVAATAANPTGGNVARPTDTRLNEIRDFLKSEYNYDPGVYQGYGFQFERTNLLGRLDWNISDNHKFNVRYSQVESRDPNFVNGTSAAPSSFTSGAGRTDVNSLNFNSANYYQEANFYSLSAEWNGTFGRFSNTLRASRTRQNDPRTTDGPLFPFVDILEGGQPYTSFGTELFSYGNLRDVSTYSFVDNLKWTAGKHNFTVGFQADFSTTKNGFQRYGTSYYRYNSVDDFLNKANPATYALTYSLAPGYAQSFPSFKFAQYSIYGQDDYRVNDNFRITAGLRLDRPTYPKVLGQHPLVTPLTFANNEKLNTATLPTAKIMFSPRVGFNWDVNGDRSLQVRGGSGIFTGRLPFVWIVSQASDAGLLQITQINDGTAGNEVPGIFNPDPNAYRPTTQPKAGTTLPSAMTFISPDLKMPQTWKTSLAVDTKLPFGFVGTLEGIYNKDLQTAFWRNANLSDPTDLSITGYPDHRAFYPSANADKYINNIAGGQVTPTATGAFNTYVLDNANKGYYWSVTAKLDKQFSRNFSASLAYIKSEAKNLYDGSGDQAGSAWQGTQTINGSNSQELSYANYIAPNRVVASFSYAKEFLKHAKSTFTFFYQGSIDGRFSYVYSSDFNRDGANADLIYIPKNPSEITFVPLTVGSGANAVTYTAQQQSDMFFRYVDQDAYLKNHKGQYAQRNGANLPWRNQVDFKFLQDLFVNVGGKRNTIQFSFDIFNLGNLLNKNWGLHKLVNTRGLLVPTNNTAIAADGTTVPTFRIATDRGLPVSTTFRDDVSISSTYYMQFGLRYIFN
ncbi:TonB-dependent receptor [Mucilaginibacter sp. 14171R-50]|uniref:TonB-dependent receptor n=1 Tax=Mucilaginibacter sp. 14171R-50 TaxID=2703789 RepID=UPI00138D6B8B|nr:carboxypeptidase regulatory-like domain-containing protein [Mucilaginibacter sp. 14171R-50]QHS57397.1 TonB-dependent receptor [Mucilaginibacter sp. 14171R-50]